MLGDLYWAGVLQAGSHQLCCDSTQHIRGGNIAAVSSFTIPLSLFTHLSPGPSLYTPLSPLFTHLSLLSLHTSLPSLYIPLSPLFTHPSPLTHTPLSPLFTHLSPLSLHTSLPSLYTPLSPHTHTPPLSPHTHTPSLPSHTHPLSPLMHTAFSPSLVGWEQKLGRAHSTFPRASWTSSTHSPSYGRRRTCTTDRHSGTGVSYLFSFLFSGWASCSVPCCQWWSSSQLSCCSTSKRYVARSPAGRVVCHSPPPIPCPLQYSLIWNLTPDKRATFRAARTNFLFVFLLLLSLFVILVPVGVTVSRYNILYYNFRVRLAILCFLFSSSPAACDPV